MKSDINILQVNTSDYGGGAEKTAFHLFNQYRSLGYQSWMIVGKKLTTDTDIYEIPVAIPNFKLGPQIYCIIDRLIQNIAPNVQKDRSIKLFLNNLAEGRTSITRMITNLSGKEDFNFPGTIKILDLLPQKPDIVHLNNLHGNYFDLHYLPELSQLFPVILNLHDMWTITGHCALPINCERWKIGCGHCPDLNIYPKIARDATKFNRQRKKGIFGESKLFITTPSKWLMDQVNLSHMFPVVESKVIPNAINIGTFQPGIKKTSRESLDLAVDSHIILFFAHNEFKDVQTMKTALRLLRKGNMPLIFICVGLTGKAEPLGEGKIIYTGKITDERKLVQYYQSADVYIHAAHHEVFGISIIEAMACGIPVVATGLDGIPEIINDGINGYLVPPKDPYAMSSKVQNLLGDSDLRIKIGMNAVDHARKMYCLERQASDFLNWYHEIASRNS